MQKQQLEFVREEDFDEEKEWEADLEEREAGGEEGERWGWMNGENGQMGGVNGKSEGGDKWIKLSGRW